MNSIKTVFLMTLMFVLFLFAGNMLGGQGGMMIAFVIALVMNFGSYWFSDKIVLKMYRAKPLDRNSAPKLFSLVENLTVRAGLPMPKLYAVDDPTPNAFATGRNAQNSAVVVTTGILRILNTEEIEGVLAHELAHIKNKDILIGSVVATFVGTISFLVQMAQWAYFFGRGGNDDDNWIASLLMIILAPIIATLIQLGISRSREYLADESGARFAANPLGLASALEKLSTANQIKGVSHSEPATAHMFIVNPLSGRSFMKLFSTHPPIEERVRRLRGMKI
ncbi:MAG: zinc metalloprotease HtpX [Ignavibacteriales bacterium]|jgi:heat shock protein HtpX|nr:zinc metalloprotease HtpX [Ignavibacteriaceae bacterium]NLH61215.1 zinc metalloprotease HtpX [Ignavibacteriales bacterium]HOJ19101.1 zinc metalloprotease HtpX [Ignavibacteriaceae bacterium]HPO54620.1 zinc metalloprotease HtpX [Ignavibacteriaceae bacterium]